MTRWGTARLAGSPALSAAPPATTATGVEDPARRAAGAAGPLVRDTPPHHRGPRARRRTGAPRAGPGGRRAAAARCGRTHRRRARARRGGSGGAGGGAAPRAPRRLRVGGGARPAARDRRGGPRLAGARRRSRAAARPAAAPRAARTTTRRSSPGATRCSPRCRSTTTPTRRAIERGWRHHLVDHRRPRAARHGQQRRRRRPRAPARRRGRRPAARAAEHELPLPLRADRRARGARSPRSLPDPLDTVFLVNSGSEAADLAIRDRAGRDRPAATSSRWGRRTTGGRSPATPSPPPSPTTRTRSGPGPPGCTPSTRPTPTAAATAAPTAATLRRRRRRRDRRARRGRARRRPAFIAEAFFGNAGGVAAARRATSPTVYAAVRAAGGLAIADEVQVGFGRLGALVLGLPAAGRRPRRRRGREVARQRAPGRRGRSPPRRSPTRYRDAGVVLLLHRRQPGCPAWSALAVLDVIRERGPAGERPRGRRPAEGGAAGARRPAPDHRRRARRGALPRRRARPRPRDPRARDRRRPRRSATACSSSASSCSRPATARTC